MFLQTLGISALCSEEGILKITGLKWNLGYIEKEMRKCKFIEEQLKKTKESKMYHLLWSNISSWKILVE